MWLSRLVPAPRDRKSTRLNSSHSSISYAVFCLKKKKKRLSECEELQQRIHLPSCSSGDSCLRCGTRVVQRHAAPPYVLAWPLRRLSSFCGRHRPTQGTPYPSRDLLPADERADFGTELVRYRLGHVLPGVESSTFFFF